MTIGFINAVQLKKAIQVISPNTPIILTILSQCRTVANYPGLKVARSGKEAISLFVKQLEPLLSPVGGRLIMMSHHCLNLTQNQNSHWDFQLVLHFNNIDNFTDMLTIEDFNIAVKDFYAGTLTFESVISY